MCKNYILEIEECPKQLCQNSKVWFLEKIEQTLYEQVLFALIGAIGKRDDGQGRE